jgi:acetoin utilization deacetylase AcuC-like enzyme
VRAPEPVTDEALCRVHTAEYVARISALAGRVEALDGDTYTSPASVAVAKLAAGAGVQAVDAVLKAEGPTRALALVRPPGHHAERDRAMGFCLFNTVAVAAAHARALGVERVAIVDYDVHHGNGTQQAFYDDPAVLFVSTHQHPYYPGTGATSEIGTGAGRGFTVNLPMAAGAGDADYELVFAEAVMPILEQFQPNLLLISAGVDAFVDDPLGGMAVSARQFGRMTASLARLADTTCGGRVVGVTEGGYDAHGLRQCLRAIIEALGEAPPDPDDPLEAPAQPASQVAARGAAAVAALRQEMRGIWTL